MMWDGAEPYCPIPVDAEPDEHILEPRCYCGRLLELGACPVHGYPVERAVSVSDGSGD